MKALAVFACFIATWAVYWQLYFEENRYSINDWLLTFTGIALTIGFWRKKKWAFYLFVIVLAFKQFKSVFEGTWQLTTGDIVPLTILLILIFNYKYLK